MPQADILSFSPTLLFLPAVFLGGYFFFATRWAPRVILTLKARSWLTRFDTRAAGVAAALAESDAWPEIFLMFVQFAGLVYFVSTLSVVARPADSRLTPLGWTPPPAATFEVSGGAALENFFFLWGSARGAFFFAPAGAELSALVDRVLGGFSYFAPGKQFPALGVKLRDRLSREAAKLNSEGTPRND